MRTLSAAVGVPFAKYKTTNLIRMPLPGLRPAGGREQF